MKIIAVLLLSASLAVSAHGFSQITLSEKNAPLQSIFEKIEKQSDYTFAYAVSQLTVAKKVSIQIINGSLEEVLQICFKDQPFTYAIIEKTIVVKPIEEKTPNAETTNVALSIDVSGKIINENGEPVAATVTVKETKIATPTDGDGNFYLKAVDENATLVITGISIEAREIKVAGRKNITVSVKTKVAGLQEVIINKGYYSEKQKTSVSNAVTISAKDIEKQPVQNPLLALQGRVPGLFVTQGSGNAGGNLKVRIQGENSILNGNDPLYVVDGVPIDAQLPKTGNDFVMAMGFMTPSREQYGTGSPLNYINPLDIESVEILKDADATAIYGSRAANGAILITTKKGKAGEMKFDLNMETGWGKVTRRVDMMNTRQYLDMRYEAFANDGIDWRQPGVSATDLKVWDTTRYTNWQDELLGGTAKYNNINASVSGGSPNVRYLVSGTYHKETTVFPLPGDFANQKASVHFNLNASNNNQKLKMQFTGNYMFDDNHLPSMDMTQAALLLEPHAPPLLNADESINWAPDANGNTTWGVDNVMVQRYKKYINKTHNLVSSLRVDYTILRGLTVGSSFGYNYLRTNDFSQSPLIAIAPELRASSQRSAAFGDRNLQSWIIEAQASYRTMIKKGALDLLVGSTFQDRKATSGHITTIGQLSDDLLTNMNAATKISTGFASSSSYRYNGFFVRASYNWQDKYVVTMNARRDGSTRFGGDNRFYNFGSVGAAWLFSNESFFKSNFEFISFGKLRGNYGTTGSDQIGDYRFMSLYNFYNSASVPYQGISALWPAGLPNPELEWEETKKLQLGIDLGFLKDKLIVNVNYVRNRSSNQLLDYNLPSPAGFGNYLVNFPATIQNRNWEFMVTGKIIQGKNLIWSGTINLTIPQNKLIEFPNLDSSAYANRLVIGEPIDVYKIYHVQGVAAVTGDYLYADNNGHLTLSPDGLKDRSVFISFFQQFYGGFQNSVSYKNFHLDFIFQFVKQTGLIDAAVWNGVKYPGMFQAGFSNQPVTLLDRWQKPGDNASVAKYSTYDVRYISSSDRRYADASYISLKNLSLSWDLPQKWVKKAQFRNFRIYTHAQNLLTLTNYQGINPETQSMSNLPPLQVWTVGVQLGL